MSHQAPNTAEDVRLQAAQWFARVQSGQATHEDIDACTAWRRAHANHDAAYRDVEFLWQASGQLPQTELRAMLAASRTATSHRLAQQSAATRTTHRLPWAWIATFATAAAVIVAVPLLSADAITYHAAFETPANERRDIDLPDGSVLNLNANTRVEVAFTEGRRDVTLIQGQAFFAVQHEPKRQFVVQTDAVTVTVTGTRFDVRQDDSRVAVESGSVEVSEGRWWNKTERKLTAGQAVMQEASGQLSAVASIQIENALAWREGKIVFRNAPLVQVVDEMNRYLKHPAQLNAPSLQHYRVAGVFNIDDPEAILAALPAVAPVQVHINPQGGAVITRR